MRVVTICLAFFLGLYMSQNPVQAEQRDHFLPSTSTLPNHWQPRLLLSEQIPQSGSRRQPVLYVHGSTFPSALSIFFKLEGRSWADHLNDAGFDVFGLDFAGYGGSDRYPETTETTHQGRNPPGRADATLEQIERAVKFIIKETGADKVSIIAHSWGTVAATGFAGQYPDLVHRLVLFGPIAQRAGATVNNIVKPYLYVTTKGQHERFIASVPQGEQSVLVEPDFQRWAEEYLDSDPTSRTRTPPSVMVPAGPRADLAAAWSGQFAFDLSRIKAPTLIIRGQWDPVTQDADVAWLKTALSQTKTVNDITIPRATHLMHLENGRFELYTATETFLKEEDW